MTRQTAMADKTRIVVLGGGFGGMYTVMALERLLGRHPGVEITLVNKDNYFVFTPMLHEVAASDLDLTHIVNPIRKLLRRAAFFHGDVLDIDLANQAVTVSHGVDQDHPHRLAYDHLVIGLGSVSNFFDTPGVQPRCFTMKTLGDAIDLRNRLIDSMEEADFECCPEVRRRMMTFVVAGAGFAGVETIAAIRDYMHAALRHYRNLCRDDIRLVLVHPGETVLPELDAKLGRYAQRKLIERGVDVRLGAKVESFGERSVRLSDGTEIATANLIWTAGSAPNPLLAGLPCRRERGRIAVDPFLQVEGWPNVWSLGDCAAVPDPAGDLCPPTAQHASRQGKILAHNIAATIRGGQTRTFAFRSVGQLAAIGRRTGVANIFGWRFSGFLAWWLWRTVYLMKLPRFERKLRVALDWTLDLIFSKDLVQCPTQRSRAVERGRMFESDETVILRSAS
ncbi:MAG TPA: NAD(P)/FAD-dependent oxidoreductase [Terriglobales bacterium]|nr:NAD(P)/FAD-dependent oxidoreductase [Terriglobales bacterium]